MNQEPSKRELSCNLEDLALLGAFYEQLYALEFRDPNERESLDNMKAYLQLKAEGWYGFNNYHILTIGRGHDVVAASIVDYLAEPNAGVIEFLVVHPDYRKHGLGRRLCAWTEEVLQADAARAGKGALDWIIAEMNDPFKTPKDSINPFARALVWHAWGYEKLQFPYVQPSLGEGKSAVLNLLLMAKVLNPSLAAQLPSGWVLSVLHEYMRWAMRIDDPDTHADYLAMKRHLDKTPYVSCIPLRTYIGESKDYSVVVEEIRDPSSPDVDAVQTIYAAQFRKPSICVPAEAFRRTLRRREAGHLEYEYHLWGIKAAADAPVEGMASFFTFPGAGFLGYVVFSGSLRGTGRFASFLARLERRMLEDDRDATGWYIECDPEEQSVDIFTRFGFWEIDVTYRQPPLPGSGDHLLAQAPVLHLLYKPFGECFGPPLLPKTDFLDAMAWILRGVYCVDRVQESEFHRDLQRQMDQTHEAFVPWKRRLPPKP